MIRQIEMSVRNFAKEIDRLASNKEKSKAKTITEPGRTQEWKNEQINFIDASFIKGTEPERKRAIAQVEYFIKWGRNYIYSQVQNIDKESVDRVKAVAPLTLTEYEKGVLLESLRGNYWGLRAYCSMIGGNTTDTAEGVLKNAAVSSVHPSPEYYYNLFDAIEEELKTFINQYAGNMTPTNATTPEEIQSILLLQSDYFNEKAEALNYNATFFVETDADGLTWPENSYLQTQLVGVPSYELKERVLDLAKDPKTKDMLLRSRWANIILEDSKNQTFNTAYIKFIRGEELTRDEMIVVNEFRTKYGIDR